MGLKTQEALKLALEALEYVCIHYCQDTPECAEQAITALRRKLKQTAQQEQPPSGYCWDEDDLCFRTHIGLLCAPDFHDKWFSRRAEFVTFKTRTTTGTIPPWGEPAPQQPVLCINPKVIDPATGKVRNGTGALTYSDEPCAGWTLPLYTRPQAREPLTDEQRKYVVEMWKGGNWTAGDIIDAVEAAHGIGEKK